MRSYPIWNDVSACIYNSSKSWGARDTCSVSVNVGSSATNSNELLTHHTTRRDAGHGFTVFTFGVDIPGKKSKVIHRLWMNDKTKETTTREPKQIRDARAQRTAGAI